MGRQQGFLGALEKDMKLHRKEQVKYISLEMPPMCANDYYNIASNRRKLKRNQASDLIPNT